MTFRTQTTIADPADQHLIFIIINFFLKMAKFGLFSGGWDNNIFVLWARGLNLLKKRKKRSFKTQDDNNAIDMQTKYTAFILQVFYLFFVLCMSRMTWFR